MSEKPNIVLLVMDTARASSFSAYGHEMETDSNFKQLADEGILFERAYSNCIWTLPSHYSIFTGLLPSHHRVKNKDIRSTDAEFFTEFLSKEEGYRTFAVSNNGYVSPAFGFDEHFDEFEFLADSADFSDKLFFEEDEIFLDIATEDWESTSKKYTEFLKRSIKNFHPKTLVNGFYYLLKHKNSGGNNWKDGAEEANEVFREKANTGEEPFFGFINYVEPHDPYTPPLDIVNDLLPPGFSYEEAMEISEKAHLVDMMKEGENLEGKEVLKTLYDGEIKYLDQKISELVDDIETETERDTIFVITSDHGENFEGGLWGHYGQITEELIHVPLLIYGTDKTGKIKENFSLRNLEKVIKNISKGEMEIPTSEKVITEYWGLESHNWNIEAGQLPVEFFQNQKSVIADELHIWSERNEIDSDIKDYIQMRCGDL
jgi:arylsulfatase A-like enzyme